MEEYVYVYGARPGGWNPKGFKMSTLRVFTDVYHLGKHIISEWIKLKNSSGGFSPYKTFEEWLVQLGRYSPKVYKMPLNREPDKRSPLNSKVLLEEMRNCEELKRDFIKLMLKE